MSGDGADDYDRFSDGVSDYGTVGACEGQADGKPASGKFLMDIRDEIEANSYITQPSIIYLTG